jgi:hypothetical protein
MTNMSGRTRWAAVIVAAGFLVGGCGTTTIDESVDGDPTSELSEEELTGGEDRDLAVDDVSPLDTGVIVDSGAPATTVPIEGSAADLLPELGVEMSRLSAEIAGDGDEDATIARIEGLWAAVMDEVEATHPQLVNGIQATVDMARVAVDSNRPADGDKAFGVLNDLIDEYTGDG